MQTALETVAHYPALLQDFYLVAPLEKYATQVMRRRAASPMILVLLNAPLTVTHPPRMQELSSVEHWVETHTYMESAQ